MRCSLQSIPTSTMKTRPSISRKSRLLRKMRTRTPIFPVQRKKSRWWIRFPLRGVVPNQKYEVTGTLIDKETKKPVEADGKPVTAKASFKPKESAGTVDVTFTFDASSLKGKTVVVFESLAYKDKEVPYTQTLRMKDRLFTSRKSKPLQQMLLPAHTMQNRKKN